jgi:hypothetical protein
VSDLITEPCYCVESSVQRDREVSISGWRRSLAAESIVDLDPFHGNAKRFVRDHRGNPDPHAPGAEHQHVMEVRVPR